MNLKIFESTFASFKPTSLGSPNKSNQDHNCPGSCQAQLNGAFWLANQRYWAYKCFCCQERQIQKGQQPNYSWGGQNV